MIPKSKQKQGKRIKRWIKIWHYWAGALVSIQLLIWLTSGVYFNLTPHDVLKGMQYHHSHHAAQEAPQRFDALKLVDLAPLLAKYPPMQSVKLQALAGKPVYVFDSKIERYQDQCQQQMLLDAYSGVQIFIDKPLAAQLALKSYIGPGDITDIKQLAAPISEWPKQCDPLWEISMSDDLQTRIYLSTVNGELIGHKNNDTDLADLMFKLHFMDYLNQGSFNNPFSWLFGVLTLLLSLSGLYWVAENLMQKRYRFTVKRAAKKAKG